MSLLVTMPTSWPSADRTGTASIEFLTITIATIRSSVVGSTHMVHGRAMARTERRRNASGPIGHSAKTARSSTMPRQAPPDAMTRCRSPVWIITDQAADTVDVGVTQTGGVLITSAATARR